MKPTGGSGASGWQVGSTVSGRREREGDTGSVFNPGWAKAKMFAGPDLFPGALFQFFDFFSFSVFCFYFYLLQKCFKSIQTTFRNFLKINAMI
jgi:hypothetical protein